MEPAWCTAPPLTPLWWDPAGVRMFSLEISPCYLGDQIPLITDVPPAAAVGSRSHAQRTRLVHAGGHAPRAGVIWGSLAQPVPISSPFAPFSNHLQGLEFPWALETPPGAAEEGIPGASPARPLCHRDSPPAALHPGASDQDADVPDEAQAGLHPHGLRFPVWHLPPLPWQNLASVRPRCHGVPVPCALPAGGRSSWATRRRSCVAGGPGTSLCTLLT